MKKNKKVKHIVIIVLLILACMGINNIPVFKITPQGTEYVFNTLVSEYNPENTDICILKYEQVTGAGWHVFKSTNKELEGKYVAINARCNPRLLKLNEDFSLDYIARYVCAIDKNYKFTEIDGEDVEMIYPKEIIITNHYYENDGYSSLRFRDLNIAGKIGFVATIFVPEFRIYN